jgi:hypothetical protein
VHLHLSGGGSSPEPADREGLDRLIADVGTALQGPTGAGIFEDDKRARFSAKVAHEVRATIEALARLETRLTEICGWSSARGA